MQFAGGGVMFLITIFPVMYFPEHGTVCCETEGVIVCPFKDCIVPVILLPLTHAVLPDKILDAVEVAGVWLAKLATLTLPSPL